MDALFLKQCSSFPFASKHTLNFPSIPQSKALHFPLPFNLEKSRNYSNAARRNDPTFNEAAYEAERLSLDAAARKSMAESSEIEGQDPDDPKVWKWIIRKRVWDLMEARNIAQFPRPVHHRIPNFLGSHIAASKLSELEVFKEAACVKVNPDTPQKQVRFLTLNDGESDPGIISTRFLVLSRKTTAHQETKKARKQGAGEFSGVATPILKSGCGKKLLTPQPRLRTGFFSILEDSMLSPSTIKEACTSVGVAKYGKPIGLEEKIKVDLIVIGSVAVDPKTGARLGKGEGFAELEYGMLRYMDAINDFTPVITSVHDEQLVDDIPVEKLLVHDVPVDIICTPSQVIFTNTSIPKPQGIHWDKLSPEKLGQIRILRELKSKIERESGQKLPCGPSEKLPPTARRSR